MYGAFRCGHSRKPSNRTPTHQTKGCGYQCKLCRVKGRKYRRDKSRQARLKPFMSKQKGKCAICKRELMYGFLDHDHKCCLRGCDLCIRGLLCPSCNGGLHLVENLKLLKAAIKYLKKWETK